MWGDAKQRARVVCAGALALAVAAVVSGAPAGAARSQVAPQGIDVSHWNGTIDWLQVAAADTGFVFANATEGTTITDATYPLNRSGAASVGLRFGAYHFARPSGASDAAVVSSAIAQADAFVAYAQPHAGDLLPALDFEATGGLSSTRLTEWVQAWLAEVTATLGVHPLIYASPKFWQSAVGDTPLFAIAGNRLWIAHWTQSALPILPGAGWGGLGWTFWQWTDCARIPGIVHCVDGDRFNGDTLDPVTIPPYPAGVPAPSAQPSIVGTPQTGQLLAAVPGSWAGGKPISFSYQWHRCGGTAGGCAPIPGAISETYKPTAADAGHALSVSVTAQAAGGTAVASSPVTLAVAGTAVAPAAAPKATVSPTIEGTPEVGQTLTGREGTWSGAPTAFAFQWRRCAAGTVGCAAIPGAAAATYTLTPDDIGASLSLVVTATGSGGSRTVTTGATSAVVPAPTPVPTPTTAVAQTGQAGAVISTDQSATVTWQPGVLPAQATVSLTPSSSRLALPATAVTLAIGATSPLPWPLDVQYAAAAPDAVAGFLPQTGVWQAVPQLTGPTLPAGQQVGTYRDVSGLLHVLTRVPGRVALFNPGKWGDPRYDSATRPLLNLLTQLTTARQADGTVLLYGRFTLDSQAHLYVSVVTPGGGQALMLQQGSRLGWWLNGRPTKTFQTLQLRPGAIPIRARIPTQQLLSSGRYALRLVAIDPYGRRTQLVAPFVPPR